MSPESALSPLANTVIPPAQAMVLAAGRGERMRPLTDHCPKPLLQVRGRALLVHHLDALAAGGVRSVLINTAWLGDQVAHQIGPAWGEVVVRFSHEGRDFGGALETAGGIVRALPQLDEVFWLVAGDVYAPGFAFDAARLARFADSGALGHLFLVPNPPHNPKGDFALDAQGFVRNDAQGRHTYSTIALLRQSLFEGWGDGLRGNPKGIAGPLAPLLRRAADNGQLTGELYTGPWIDVGTPQRLKELNAS